MKIQKAEHLESAFFLCALMFAAFLTMDKQKQEVFHMSSSDIANEITKDTDIQEIWKSL